MKSEGSKPHPQALSITNLQAKELALACGFEIAGVAPALPLSDFERFDDWRRAGMAGEMTYLTDHRGDKRRDPRELLPSAQSILCVGKLYNTSAPYSTVVRDSERGWVSRYAWGADYHNTLGRSLQLLVGKLAEIHKEPFQYKICVDTAPLLERSYARAAGLGWIGRNTCLINQEQGSWFFLGELLLSILITADSPPPDRCGTCRRCIDVCPTAALVPDDNQGWKLDANLCISYLMIEKRGELPADLSAKTGNHIFGCDICQDVCPWNRRAPTTADPDFQPREIAPRLDQLNALTEEEFRKTFQSSPVKRTKYAGFRRNVAAALANRKNKDKIE